MAYDYASDSKSSPGFTRNELLTAVEAFLDYDTSWTVLQAISPTAGEGDTPATSDYSVIQKTNGTPTEDVVVHLWKGSDVSGINCIGLNTSTGYTADTNWYNQPGARFGRGNGVNARTAVYTRCTHTSDNIVEYHLFGYPEYVYCVFKTSAGIWRNFGFGHTNKLSNFVGGGFTCGSYCSYDDVYEDVANTGGYTQFFDMYTTSGSSTDMRHCQQLRIDEQGSPGDLRYGVVSHRITSFPNDASVYGVNDGWVCSGQAYSNYSTFYNGGDLAGFEHDKMLRAPSAFSLTSPLIPVYVYFSTDFTTKYRSLVGTLPNVFMLNIKSLAETQEITIQGETYTVFPASRKSTTTNTGDNLPNSYYWGFCMLKKIEA